MRPIVVILILLAGVGAIGWLVYRPGPPPPRFETGDFADRDLAAALDEIVEATVKTGVPAAIIYARTPSKTHLAVAGKTEKSGDAATGAEPLRIGSVSKIYTAAVIMDLAARGALDLEARLPTLLPADVTEDLPNGEAATVDMLLRHTSGIPDYYDLRSYLLWDWREPITLDRTLPVAKRQSAPHAPGETYAYSNMNFVLLGAIAEDATGASLGPQIAQVIGTPLDLSDTSFNVQYPVSNGLHGYGMTLTPWRDTYGLWEHSGPDAGVMATAEETADVLAALFLPGGALQPLGAAMIADPTPISPRRAQGRGVEIIATRSGLTLYGHTGSVFGYRTFAFAIPEAETVIVGHITQGRDDMLSAMLRNTLVAVQATEAKAD